MMAKGKGGNLIKAHQSIVIFLSFFELKAEICRQGSILQNIFAVNYSFFSMQQFALISKVQIECVYLQGTQ